MSPRIAQDATQLEAKREKILEAAAGVFAATGYQRATTRRIAAAAGVSEGTLYSYFKSKEELFLAMAANLRRRTRVPAERDVDDVRSALIDGLTRSLSAPRLTDEMFAAVFSEVLVNAKLRRLYVEGTLRPYLERAERFVERSVARRSIKAVDPALAARIFFAVGLGLGLLRLLGDPVLHPRKGRIEDLVRLLVDTLFEGIRRRR